MTLLIGFASCTTYVYDELTYIHKGMSLNEVSDIVSSEDFSDGIFMISENRDDDVYDLNMEGQSGLKYLVTEKYFQDEDGYYVFLFQDDKLIYWGLPYEFVNNRNATIKNASINISNTIVSEYLED